MPYDFVRGWVEGLNWHKTSAEGVANMLNFKCLYKEKISMLGRV